MKKLVCRLWQEESAAIVSAEIVLVMTILVIGVIVGLKSVRDSVVTELADVGQAIANVNQSYSFSAVSGHHTYSGGGSFNDNADFCDNANAWDGGNSKCVAICSSATVAEGNYNYNSNNGNW